ncbi:uncharacterized protein LOC126785801 isoform X4 [Argentina anserina]|uniref:uncharacterized protein LOC126785801 isoform X4 n=1 Tax=Argentina anserina TaxID=57926 RepID=UPI00217684C2|nr:uncharacterized protein LOC126785801 isoform X4 [Potentilla anserina]
MAETPKLDLGSIDEVHGLEVKMGTQKISVSDHLNGFHYTADKSDNFVIDMESFNHGITDKDVTANSRISRNHSRKWLQRVGDKKISTDGNSNDRDISTSAISSPKGIVDHPGSPQVHHQITVTATNIGATADGRCVVRRNSFRRSSFWAVDPKRVLFFFATLSSIGTILLIYFTLAIGKYNLEENSLDW